MSVLVLSWDRIGEMMAGSAIRALEMASALERHGVAVRLVAPEGSEAPAGAPPLETFRLGDSLLGPIRRSAAVVVPGRVELLAAVTRPLVVDLYDPFVLSNLDFFGSDFARSGGRALLALRWLQHHLSTGDFFLCASSVQRSFWLGMLAAAGRLNRANYEADPELSRLLAVVPFGVPDQPPRPGPARVKGVMPGIGESDRLVLWAGGMWNWVDPLTLIRAAHLLRDRRPEVRTLLLGGRHPNPAIGEMEVARASRELARELELEGSRVFFLDWVPYEERHLYVLESDVGVSLHRSGVESEFAFRTRVLDYLWCARPMVLSRGDDLAARVEREDLGRVVEADDAAAVARAIEDLLDDPGAAERRARLERARVELAWSRAVKPLVEFCRAPRLAPDRDGRAFVAAPRRREDLPRKEQALVTEEFVGPARAISPPLGADGAEARQRFRARYPRLCQLDVLFWIEPPVEGEKVVFELFARDEEPRRIVRVAVAATQLPAVDWQRFEFSPQEDSQGREYEFRLRLERPAGLEAPGGRVCVWHTVPPEGPAGEGDGVAFMARYLLDGIVRHLPAGEESFLFAHNTSVPLGDASESTGALSPEVELPTGAPAADFDGLRAELARLSAKAADLDLRSRVLERRLDELSGRAREAPAVERPALPHLRGLVRDLIRIGGRAARALRRVGLGGLALVLGAAALPLAVLGAIGIGAVEALAALRRRPARTVLPEGPAPSPDGPVSIVVPTWNGLRLLEESLPALVRAVSRHGHPDDEILIVDNASEDGTAEWVAERAKQVRGLRCIALERNRGFAGAANRGVAEARSGAVVLLNNDMVVEPDFLQPLLDAFGEEPDLFGVSSQIDFVDPEKPRWETGKVHGELRWGQLRLFHLDRFDPELRYPILFAGGGASAYDRRRLLALGGFDERVFRPVYIEDVDLGFRAWQRGWPSVLAPTSRVHHRHRSTTRRLWSEARIESFFRKNLVALVWKDFRSPRLLAAHLAGLLVLPLRVQRSHGGRAALATLAGLWLQLPRLLAARLREARAERRLRDEEVLSLSRWRFLYRARFHPDPPSPSRRPQVLVIAPYSPMPALHGGAVRMWNLIREVGSEVDVTLLSLVDTPAEAASESLARLREVCRDAELVPRELGSGGGRLEPEKTRGFHSAPLRLLVEDWLERRRFDVVQVEYTHMAHYLPPPCPALRRVLVEHDVSYVARARARARAKRARALPRLGDWLDEQKAFRHEVRAIDRADLAIAMSEEDRRELARWVDPAKIRVVPNGVACRDFPFAPDDADPTTVLFVGFFRHPPNVEGVLFFARRVLPGLRRRVPAVRFRVVGAYPPPPVLELHDPERGVEVVGEVAETAPYYRSAAVFVAPILQGSGTRLKILEAMASGSAVVSTALGAEGLDAPSDTIRIADDPDAFAAAVARLLERPAERLEMARRARTFVEQRFDWGAIASRQLEAWGIAPARRGGP